MLAVPVTQTVRDIFASGEAPLRRCPVCGDERRTEYEDCPACGASYVKRPPRFTPRQKLAGAFALIAAVVTAGVLAAPSIRDDDRRDRAAREARSAEIRARATARIAREQRVMRGEARALRPEGDAPAARVLAARAALVERIEARIVEDTNARARAGELELRAPVREAVCGPLVRTTAMIPDDELLDRSIGRYDCVATIRDVVGRGRTLARLGIAFVATADFRTFEYVWCRNTPAQGERGEALTRVRIARECVGAPPDARPIGTGWAFDPAEDP